MARPALKRKQIDDAAILLFATKGLPRTSIKDIATEAGVTEGALYRYYKSKNEMAWDLFCRELETFSTELGEIFTDEALSSEQKLQNGIAYLYNYYDENPVKLAFVLLSQHGFPERDLLDEERNPNDIVVDFIKNAVNGESDPVVHAGMIMGLILQPIIMHRYGRLEGRLLQHAPQVTEACFKLLK